MKWVALPMTVAGLFLCLAGPAQAATEHQAEHAVKARYDHLGHLLVGCARSGAHFRCVAEMDSDRLFKVYAKPGRVGWRYYGLRWAYLG